MTPPSPLAPESASAALPPSHRPTGALPVVPGSDRDLHRLWWYTVAGLLSAVVLVAGFLVFVMARRLAVAEGPDASPLVVTVLAAGIAAAVAAAVGQTLATLRLRRAWEEEREPLRRTAVAALLPALLVALTPLAVPSLSAWPVLAARAEEIGGRLSAGPDDDGGFRLELTVPSSSGATTRTDLTTTTGEGA
ncbi:hypothetical protein [Micrococcus endophyticus]|uniref:hypothetical protein n=1 Tax=Micrococcus endophyticus TaxID=455343 RepID=UPI0034CE72E6